MSETAPSGSGATGGRMPQIPGVLLTGEIGRGGMGVIYRGRQTFIDREVAVKVLFSSDEDYRLRFQREAKILAGLSHPHIVGCYQAGVAEDRTCFFVMEFVDGPDLRRYIKERGALPSDHVCMLGVRVAEALTYAQEREIIHRDVKPENVLLLGAPDEIPQLATLPFTVKLADLGLARLVHTEQTEMNITQPGMAMGTPATMSPEQFVDPAAVDHLSDVYGLGCVLYHALTGRAAFTGANYMEIYKRKQAGPPPNPREVRAELPADLGELVAAMLAPRKEDRPQSYLEIIRKLGGSTKSQPTIVLPAAEERTLALPAEGAHTLQTRQAPPTGGTAAAPIEVAARSRRLAIVVVAALIGVALAGVGLWQALGRGGPEAPPEEARGEPVTTAPPAPSAKDGPQAPTSPGANKSEAIQTPAILGAVGPKPLAPGELRSLFHSEDPTKPLLGWPDYENSKQWGSSYDATTTRTQQGHLVNGRCPDGTCSIWRELPPGDWKLTGALHSLPLKGKHAEEVALAVELAPGRALALRLVLEEATQSFRFDAVEVDRAAESANWTARPGRAPIGVPVTLAADHALHFYLEKRDGERLIEVVQRRTHLIPADELSIGNLRLDDPDWQPPTRPRVFLIVTKGKACFCELTIEALRKE